MPLAKIPDRCLNCAKPLRKKDADLLSEGDNLFIFHLTCSNCRSSFIVHIVLGQEGVLTVGTLTDAGKEDLAKLKSGQVVSADDVIEAYTYLKKTGQKSKLSES